MSCCSEGTAALDIERRLRALATSSRAQAYRVEVAAKVASLLVGPGAERLIELEAQTRRRFYLEGKHDVHLDHFLVLGEGKRDDMAVKGPVEEGAEVELKLGEVGLHDPQAGVGKLDGYDVSVANASRLVGKKVTVRVERVLDSTAYATLVSHEQAVEDPITAEREAEKPTRQPAAAKKPAEPKAKAEPKAPKVAAEPKPPKPAASVSASAPKAEAEAEADGEEGSTPKKKTRRGSRGGRGRKKKTTTAPSTAAATGNGAGEPVQIEPSVARIHVPDRELGDENDEVDEASVEGDQATQQAPKKKTRRGSRGGRNRKRKTATPAASAAATADGNEPKPAEPEPANEGDWGYVPMSEWADDVLSE